MVFAAARATTRKAVNSIAHHSGHNGPGQSALHRVHGGAQVRHASTTPSPTHVPGSSTPKPTHSPPRKLFTASQNFLARFFNHLSAPGLRVPTWIHNGGAGAARSLHSGAAPTIKSGLSLHARTALSSGSRSVYLPRPPSPGVRVTTNIGLGTARNFSTARPIFQNLVDNVPVITRAFYEADLDLRKGQVRQVRARRGARSSRRKNKEMLRPRETPVVTMVQEDLEGEMDLYFRDPVAPVTTYLFVPVNPMPASRVPLPLEPILSSDPPNCLLPLSYLTSFHAIHTTHAARIQSLHLRLDQANVWAKGARYSLYGPVVDDEAVCTIVRIEFVGWTEAEVRAVIGESGTGWCALEEVWSGDVDAMSEYSSAIDSTERNIPAVKSAENPDTISSLIMPTLDLSSVDSSLPSSVFSSRPVSPATDYDDPWSDVASDAGSRPEAVTSPPLENEWSDVGGERSWDDPNAPEFGARHLNQWH